MPTMWNVWKIGSLCYGIPHVKCPIIYTIICLDSW